MNKTATPFQPNFLIDQRALASLPICPSDKVPFLRALILVGQSLFGEEWSNSERATKASGPPADMASLEAIWTKVKPLSSGLETGGLPPLDATGMRAKLEAFHQQSVRNHEANALAVARLRGAHSSLRQAIIDRKIVAYWRKDKAGAVFRVLPVEQLLNERTDLLLRGYMWDHVDRCAQHVFVDRAGLESAIAALRHAPITINQVDLSQLPDPLRIAVAIALADPSISSKGMGDRQKAAAVAWAARFPDADSNTYIEAIAITLGKPDLEKIKREKARAKANRAKN